MAALHHPDAEVSTKEIYDSFHIGYEVAGDLASVLDEADALLSSASERLQRLPSYRWDSHADIRTDIAQAQSLILRALSVMSPENDSTA